MSLLDYKELNENKELIQFIPYNCFNLNILNQNIKKILLNDFEKSLLEKGILSKNLNEIGLNSNDYITLNYEDYLLMFIGINNHYEDERKEKYYHMFYYKIELTNKNIIDIGKIDFINHNDKNIIKNSVINDINISIKNEFIYLFFICEYSKNNYINYQIYNKYTMSKVKNGEIELKNNFNPISLFNDDKYLYCISLDNQILKIKKNYNLSNQKYYKCCFRLFEKDLMNYTEIKDLSLFEMFNSLCINDYLFIYNIDIEKHYIAQIIKDKHEDYIINIYEMSEDSKNIDTIRICYNDNRFIITKIKDKKLLFDMSSKNFNSFMDKGISLLPFDSDISFDEYPDNLY